MNTVNFCSFTGGPTGPRQGGMGTTTKARPFISRLFRQGQTGQTEFCELCCRASFSHGPRMDIPKPFVRTQNGRAADTLQDGRAG